MNKNLYIISGCNGAGKTTASYTVLPDVLGCKEFVNADEIARGLSPFNPESVTIEAGRLMLQRIEDLLYKNETFSIETTLATKSYINLIRKGISNLFHLFMNEVDFWEIYDNSVFPAIQVATGSKDEGTSIIVESTYKKIADYVK